MRGDAREGCAPVVAPVHDGPAPATGAPRLGARGLGGCVCGVDRLETDFDDDGGPGPNMRALIEALTTTYQQDRKRRKRRRRR